MLDINIHRTILVRILKDLYSDSDVGPFIGFKGGTAAYLFYNLDRFSVYLDFDLLAVDSQYLVFEKIKNILRKYGELKDARKKRYTFFFLLSYNEKIFNAYNIKIEVNLRNFGSEYEIKSYLGIPMKVMVKQDMFAHKLVAMLERRAETNRDIFDVYFFLKNNWPINEEIIKKRTNMSEKQFYEKCISLLEKKSDKNILFGIGELLNSKQKAWVKINLCKETIFLLKLKLL